MIYETIKQQRQGFRVFGVKEFDNLAWFQICYKPINLHKFMNFKHVSMHWSSFVCEKQVIVHTISLQMVALLNGVSISKMRYKTIYSSLDTRIQRL